MTISSIILFVIYLSRIPQLFHPFSIYPTYTRSTIQHYITLRIIEPYSMYPVPYLDRVKDTQCFKIRLAQPRA